MYHHYSPFGRKIGRLKRGDRAIGDEAPLICCSTLYLARSTEIASCFFAVVAMHEGLAEQSSGLGTLCSISKDIACCMLRVYYQNDEINDC